MLRDQRGADTAPMRLVCYATLTAAVVWLAASGLQNAAERRADDKAALDMASLFARLDGIWGGDAIQFYSALPSPGASVQVSLALPPDTKYIAFGADPGVGLLSPRDVSGCGSAFLSAGGLGLRAWSLGHPASFGAARIRDGQLLPPEAPLVVEGGGEVALRFTLAFDPVEARYWLLCERL